MILKKIYDEKTKTQKCWYSSTMIVFTKAVEYDDKNCVDLYVVFNNGAQYKYNEVRMEDYVLLLSGYEKSSHGKTLNRMIKPKYEVERIEDANLTDIWKEFDEEQKKFSEKEHTIFISGHRDITEEEFEIYYIPIITNEIEQGLGEVNFIMGDYQGCDIMAQNYLVDVIGFDPDKITVYHMKESPRNINDKIKNTSGGYESDEERDAAMTKNSYKDIAFVRDHTKLSGTAQNILRRYKF